MKTPQIILSLVVLAICIGVFLRFDKDSNDNLEHQRVELNHKITAQIKKSEYQSAQYIDTIDFLKKNIENLNKKEAKLISLYKPKIEGIKHYNSTDIAKFYKKTYKVENGVKTTEFGTCLSDSVTKMNIRDVFQKDLAVGQLKVCNKIVSNQKEIILKKDSIIAQKDTIISLKTIALTECKKANEIGKIETKKVKKSNVLLKIGLGALAVIGIIF